VGIRFSPRGTRLFDQIAAENVNKRLAIILDGSVYSAPVIRQAHYGGQAVIEGNFTSEEARDLAIVLRAGSLPAPVEIAEKRAVGPSLGSDSIRQGLLSIVAGMLLVLVFMGVYYRIAGIVADLSLVLNLLLIMASLAAMKATLTLPGIAGLVLTMGMAVDANVLIFERIREELRMGKTPRAAVDSGYKKALLTILDSNITTMIAALVLFQFGTGPVKGFAVTLSIGVFWSVLLAIYFTREMFDYLILVRRVKSIAI
jgi:preprotein translocase subunit SecD